MDPEPTPLSNGRPPGPPDPDSWSAREFQPIASYLRDALGVRLAPHRLQLLQARLRGRLRGEGHAGFAEFTAWLSTAETRDRAAQLLIDLSTVNHTSFFREPAALKAVVNHLARLLLEQSGPIRVWSAGCSSGQEPYSLLMMLAEQVADLSPARCECWASDVSLGVLQAAARAIYDERVLGGIAVDRLRRFFLRGRGTHLGQYRVVPEIRRLVTFCHLDLHRWPWTVPGRFDAILCRNVAIYFDEPARLLLLDRLTERLRPGGWLAVGHGEILPARPGRLTKHAPSIFRKADRP